MDVSINQHTRLGSSVESQEDRIRRDMDDIRAMMRKMQNDRIRKNLDEIRAMMKEMFPAMEESKPQNDSFQLTGRAEEQLEVHQVDLNEQFLERENAHKVLDEMPERVELVVVEEETELKEKEELVQVPEGTRIVIVDQEDDLHAILSKQDEETNHALKIFDEMPQRANTEVLYQRFSHNLKFHVCSITSFICDSQMMVIFNGGRIAWPTGIGTILENLELIMFDEVMWWKSELVVMIVDFRKKNGSGLNVGSWNAKKKEIVLVHSILEADTKKNGAWDNWFKLKFFYTCEYYAVLKWSCHNYNNLGDKVDLQGVGNRGYTVLPENRHILSCIRDDRSGDVNNVAKLLIARLAHYKVGSQYHGSWKKEGKGDIKRINSWEAFDLISCLESRRSRSFVWRSLNCWKYTHNTCEFKVEQVITVKCFDKNFVTLVRHKIWVVAWNKWVQEVVASYFFQKDFRHGGSNKAWSTMSFDIKEATSNRGQHKIWKIGWYSHNFNMGIVGATWNLLSIDNCDELVNSVGVVIKYVAGSLSSIVHNHILQLLKVFGIVMFAEYAKGKITIGFLSPIIFSEPVVAVLTILLPKYFVVTIRHAAHGWSMIVILLLFMMDRGSNLVVTRINTVDMAAYDVLG